MSSKAVLFHVSKEPEMKLHVFSFICIWKFALWRFHFTNFFKDTLAFVLQCATFFSWLRSKHFQIFHVSAAGALTARTPSTTHPLLVRNTSDDTAGTSQGTAPIRNLPRGGARQRLHVRPGATNSQMVHIYHSGAHRPLSVSAVLRWEAYPQDICHVKVIFVTSIVWVSIVER